MAGNRKGLDQPTGHTHGTEVLGQYAFELDALGRARAVTETLLQPTGTTITDTATYGIAASADDASVHQVGDGSWTTTTGNTLPVGQDGVPASVTDVAGLRFTGMDLPAGAAVTQAMLSVTASGAPGQAGTTRCTSTAKRRTPPRRTARATTSPGAS